MSLKNDYQQLSLDDSFMTLTEHERKILEKSWAKIFTDKIFLAIDEEHFSILYNDRVSRPNAPINVIIGENLMFDLHLQYALHTTSFTQQPISDKTLSHFCKRCYDYEALHDIDLYHDYVKNLNSKIARIMKLNGRIQRMDSDRIQHTISESHRTDLHMHIQTDILQKSIRQNRGTVRALCRHE